MGSVQQRSCAAASTLLHCPTPAQSHPTPPMLAHNSAMFQELQDRAGVLGHHLCLKKETRLEATDYVVLQVTSTIGFHLQAPLLVQILA